MSNISVKEKRLSLGTQVAEWLMLAGIIVFFLFDVIACVKSDFLAIRQKAVMSISVEIMSLAICGFVYFSAFIDDRKNKFRSLFLGLVFFESFAFFLDTLYWFTAKIPEYNTLLIVANCLMYLCNAVVFVSFWGCEIQIMGLKGKIDKWAINFIRILTVAYVIAILLNLKFGFFYTIRDGIYTRSKYTGILEFSYPIFICEIVLFSALGVKIHPKIKLTFIAMAIIPIAAMVLQHVKYYSWFIYLAVLLDTLILHVNIQVKLGYKIEELKNKAMISQIQPHFMYNTLTTIKSLCREDPELAAKTTTNFADYLRGNLDFSTVDSTIPVEKEIKHTKIYTEIESLRFDNIKFEFKIEDKNFELPALTIQPMVENAVRHGVRGKADGHILVHTFEEGQFHVVQIKDNGKGFDTTQFNGSRTHIGLLNTQLRIEHISNGKFEIESVPDQGVTITMRIPKKA